MVVLVAAAKDPYKVTHFGRWGGVMFVGDENTWHILGDRLIPEQLL